MHVKEHFQLSDSMILCAWSGEPTTMYMITGGKVICRSCGKVVKFNEESDLYQDNGTAHLGDTRSKLHAEGKENYARDFYIHQDKTKRRVSKSTSDS